MPEINSGTHNPNPAAKAVQTHCQKPQASTHTHPPTHSLSLSFSGSFTVALRQRTTKGARKQYPPYNCTPKTAPPTRLQPQICSLEQHSRTWRHLPRQGLVGFRVELGTERKVYEIFAAVQTSWCLSHRYCLRLCTFFSKTWRCRTEEREDFAS
jgi:hypothetical protein